MIGILYLPSDFRVALSSLISPGTSCPTLFDKRAGSFTSLANHNMEDRGDGAYGL